MKSSSLLFMLFLFQATLIAQHNSFGVFGGMNYSTLKFKHHLEINGESKYLPGFLFGVNYTHQLNKKFAIRGEVVIEKKNSKYLTNFVHADGSWFGPSKFAVGVYDTGGNFNAVDHFLYAGLPIMLQVNLGQKSRYYLHIGQSISYQIHRSDNYTYGNSDKLDKWDHAILAGLDFNAPIKNNMAFQANARMTYGLNDLSTNEMMELKHFNYSLMAGIQWVIE